MKGKLVLVHFPFDDFLTTKVRPALCLTEPIGSYQHVVIAFVTSQVHRADESTDLPIQTTDPDFSSTGLKVDSAIRLHRLVTIPVSLVIRELGTLSPAQQQGVTDGLRMLFALS
jgi:mRNA interferase MazF